MNAKSDSYTLIKLSKCCPALPETLAPANAGAHAEPLYFSHVRSQQNGGRFAHIIWEWIFMGMQQR